METNPGAVETYDFLGAAQRTRELGAEELVGVVEELTELSRRTQFLLSQAMGAVEERGGREITEYAGFALDCASLFTHPRGLDDAHDHIPQPEGHYHLERAGLLPFVVGEDIDASF